MRGRFVTWTVTIVTLSISIAFTLAQNECEVFLQRAYQAIEDGCQGLGRNQACYGYDNVEAGFQMTVPDDFFTQTSDTVDIDTLQTIRTTPLDIVQNQWGVVIMLLQANLPDTLPGQNVTFILMGDTEIESAVPPETVVDPQTSITVTIALSQGAVARSGAGDNYNAVGTIATNTTILADGISEDGTWLRVIYQDRPAWIRLTTIDTTAEIDNLPVLSSERITPMQAFYLRTGIGRPDCNEAPNDTLFVQGPEEVQINLTVNGVNLELGSSGILRIVEGADEQQLLEIIVFDGQFVVKADEFNPEDVVIRAGYRSTICMDVGNDLGVDGIANDLTASCGASTPELIESPIFNEGWCNYETFPTSVLNYTIDTCYQAHTVATGETLSRIADFYCVSIDDIIALNNLQDSSFIRVGQQLVIPLNACQPVPSIIPPDTTITVSNTTDETTGTTTCDTFTIPEQPIIASDFILQWDDVTGADNYVVAVFDEAGTEYLTIPVTESELSTNGGSWSSTGFVDVRAYNGTEYACFARLSFERLPDPNPVTPIPPVFSFELVSCVDDAFTALSFVTVDYANLEAGTITLLIEDTAGIDSDSVSSTARNGQLVAQIPITSPINVTVSTTSGGTQLVTTCVP